MIILPLAAAALAVAYFQHRRTVGVTDEAARRILLRGVWIWGLAAVLIRPLEWSWFAPGGYLAEAFGRPLAGPGTASLLRVLLAFLAWAGAAGLITFRLRRRDLLRIVPFAVLSLVLVVAGVSPKGAAFCALPALWQFRWRPAVGRTTQTVLGLAGFLYLISRLLAWNTGDPGDSPAWTSAFDDFSDFFLRLVALYTILVVARIGPVPYLRFRSVKRRLLVSHVLSGLVPVTLLLIFWAISTYLSVNTERALVAKRELDREGEMLAASLAAVTGRADDEALPEELNRLASNEAARFPGLTLWRLDAPVAAGDSSLAEAIAAWPDSVADHVVLRHGAHVYLAARSPDGRAAALAPLNDWLAAQPERTIGSRFYVDPGANVEVSGGNVTIGTRSDDDDEIAGTIEPPEPAPPGTPPANETASPTEGFNVGATLLAGYEGTAQGWESTTLLMRVHVGFREAILGMTRHARGNPFNIVYLVILGIVAFLFIIVQAITLLTVSDMGRSINRAVSALRQGTRNLESGALEYRIPVEGRDDLWDLAESFNQMAVGLQRGRELEKEKQQLESELRLAREIQARLLPSGSPSIEGVELAGMSVSAREVGGDYYDFIVLPGKEDSTDGRSPWVGLVIADVSGKGVPAALLMSAFRASLLSQVSEGPDPGAIFERVNRFIHGSIETGRFVTAFLAFLHPASGRFRYANAGHNFPLVVGSGGETRWLEEGGFPIGMFEVSQYATAQETLAAGELVLLYTDGVTEAQDPEGEFLGDDRLVEAARAGARHPCADLVSELVAAVRRFESHGEPSDDVTLLAARRAPDSPGD